jgi:DNA polymerase III delta prime subunit
VDEMRNFMDEVQKKYIMMQKNRLGNNKYYFNMVNKPAARTMEGVKDFSRLPPNMVFSMKRFQTNRKFSNLFGDDISTIKDRVNFFTNNKDWYDEKGIPYTIGLLLSGLPGTGKTSTIKCLANETERHIFNINFNNDITKTQMENLFFNEQIIIDGGMEAVCIPLDQRIYVFEDIDCQNSAECISRTHSKQNQHQLDLSFLLNLLDGVLEMPGRIIILTSNNPERLDHALVRPGRIDIVANYTNCTNDTIIRMIEFFYNNTLSDAEKQLINKLEPLLLTPAEVSKLLFENFGNKDNAVLAIVDAIHNFYRKGIDSEPVPEHVPEPVSEPVSEPLPEPVSEPLPEPVYVEPFSNHAFETTYAETKSNITSPAGDDFIPSYPGMFYDGTQNFDSKPQTNKQVWHNDIHIKNPQNNKKTPEYVKELDKLIDIKDQSETTLVNNSLQYSEMENLVQELKYRSTMLDNLYQRPSETRNPNYDIVA